MLGSQALLGGRRLASRLNTVQLLGVRAAPTRRSVVRFGSLGIGLASTVAPSGFALCDGETGPESKLGIHVKKMRDAFASFDFGALGGQTTKVMKGEAPKASLAQIFGEQVNQFLESGVGGQISWGMVCGFCSGFAVKKASKVAAMLFGSVFCLLQGLSYNGFVAVDYNKMEGKAMDYLDMDGDGKFDYKDVSLMYDKLMDVLAFNIPAGSGFTAGVVMGLQKG